MKYTTEKQINDVIEGFESGTISRDAWGHAEHLILAFHYASNNDFETALKKMRSGLFVLLRAFEVDLAKEMPYHETLTVFWMKTINEFANEHKGEPIVDTINEMITKFDKHYPSKFYSQEYLFSDEARERFVEGDIASKDQEA